ncbi:MAG: T9SS type A sorting domain-containing protein [Bacteroidetes bacterium]|nr:T9SS type A sorting domain-containing protein [Bacteroidota bacterium]
MKHKLLFTISLFVAMAMSAQTIPNSGFEFWNASSIDNPLYYPQTSNQQALQAGLPQNALKVTDPQQGTLAIQLNTVTNGVDTMFGYFLNGDPNSLAGGIPYSQHPITLTGYYKCNVMAGDTAFVFIVFKQGGIAVSQDFAIFTGNHSSAYVPFTLTLTIPALATPDSIIVGAASSNAFVNRGIPGSMLQLDNLTFTGVSSQPTMMNGSFENWISINTSTPQNWGTAGDLIYQTNDAHTGTYAVEMNTFSYGGPNVSPSYITNGVFPPQSGPQGGRPYTLLNDTLCGWYKYIPVGIDSATIYLSTSQNTVGVGGGVLGLPPVSVYTFFSMPFSSFMQPDTLLIVLASGYNGSDASNVGSVFKVDDLYLKSSAVGIAVLNWNTFGKVQLYPNPSSVDCWMEFDNNENSPMKMTVTDELGKTVSEIEITGTGHQRQHIDTSVLSKGIYVVTLTQNGNHTSRKLFVD